MKKVALSAIVVLCGLPLAQAAGPLDSWTSRSSGTTNSLFGVSFLNGHFVASGSPGSVQVSADGVTWSSHNTGNTNALASATFDGSKYVLAGSSGTILTSPDLVNWAQQTSGTTNLLRELTYVGGTFVVVGRLGTILTSTDATNWISRASGTTNDLNGVAYGNGLFVAVGKAGVIVSSPDGAAWTSRTSGTASDLPGLVFGNGKFVASGGGGEILTSANGIAWTSQSSGASHELSGVTYANGIFVAVGSAGSGFQTIDTSVDATNWIVRTETASSSVLYRAAYGNGTFVAVGNAGTILQSGDTILAFVSANFNGANFTVTIANGLGRVFRVQASTDLTTWTDLAHLVSSGAQTVFADPVGNQADRFYRAATDDGSSYSANVVGYINVAVPLSNSLIAVQLRAALANHLQAILPVPPDGTTVLKVSGSGLQCSFFDAGGGDWFDCDLGDPSSMAIAPGEAAILSTGSPFTATFVGEVPQGDLTNQVPAGLSLCSSILPRSGRIVSDLGFPAQAGDTIYQFEAVNQVYDTYTYLGGGVWTPSEPVMSIAEGFWVELGSARTWITSFSLSQPVVPYSIANPAYIGGANPQVPGRVPPAILTQPQSQTTSAGSNAVFSVTAVGSPPLHYQWLSNSAPLAGATNAAFTSYNVQAGPAIGYSAIITNAYGAVTSAVASLTASEACGSPTIFPIAANGATAARSAAFDGSNYMVAINTGGNLAAQLVSQTGALVGPIITNIGASKGFPTLAFGSTNYLMVWYDDSATNGPNKFGQILTPGGLKLGNAFALSPNFSGGLRGLASDGSSFLVILASGSSNFYYGQLVSETGALLATTQFINTDPYGSDDMAIGFDGANYLVVWDRQAQPTDSDVYGQFVGRNGALVGSNFIIDSNLLPSDNPMAVGFDGTRYLVVFPDEVGGQGTGTWDLFGRFVTPAGAVLPDRIAITTDPGAQLFPSLAFDGANWLVCWSDGLGTTNANVNAKFFTASGQPMSSAFPLFAAQGTNLPSLGGVLYGPDKYAAIGFLGFSTTNFQFLSSAVYGTFLAPFPSGTFPLGITGQREEAFSAAFDGTNYLIGIQGDAADQHNITAQLFSGSGALLGARISLGRTGGTPFVAFGGTNYLMVFVDDSTSPNQIYAQRISRTGELVGSPLKLSTNSNNAQSFDSTARPVASDGTNFLVVWRESVGQASTIFGRVIPSSGDLTSPSFTVSSPGQEDRSPTLAFGSGGTNYLVVWEHDDTPGFGNDAFNTLGVLVSTGGVVLSPAQLISQSPSTFYSPVGLAFDGSNYFAVFGRTTEPACQHCNPSHLDLYGRLVSGAGLPIGGEISIATGPGLRLPGVSFDGDNYLAGWFELSSDCAPWRTRFRFFDKGGRPLGTEFELFGPQGLRSPDVSVFFEGGKYLAISTVDDFNNSLEGLDGDVYGLFIPKRAPFEPLAPTIFVNGQEVAGASLMATNSVALAFESALPDAHIYFTLDGSDPSGGLLYIGPVAVTQSVMIRAVAYTADFTLSAEANPVTLTVVLAPAIVRQPESETVAAGANGSLSVLAVGTEPLIYQWYHNGMLLLAATNADLLFAPVRLTDGGDYSVTVANPFGSMLSSTATVSVLNAPGFAGPPAGTNVNLGVSVIFCANASGDPPLRYQWRKNGANLTDQTNDCLVIGPVTVSDGAGYSVVVGNAVGVASSPEAELTVVVPQVPPGDNFANRVAISGTNGFASGTNFFATREAGEPYHADKVGSNSVWYTWQAPATGVATFRTAGSTFDTLLGIYTGTAVNALTEVAGDDDSGGFFTSSVRFNTVAGVNYQIAIDSFAGGQGRFILSWDLAAAEVLPEIVVQPQSLTVPQGSGASFTVSVTPPNGLSYQWYFEGQPLAGQTGPNFVLAQVRDLDVGAYSVRVSNAGGQFIDSDLAYLEIGPLAGAQSQNKLEDLFSLPPLAAALKTRGRLDASPGTFVSVAAGTIQGQIFTTTNSTTQARETNACGVIGGSSRWFQLQAATNGRMLVDTVGSSFDTVLSVYTGSSFATLSLVGCNNDASPDVTWSRVAFEATSGAFYVIAVDGMDGSNGIVHLNFGLGQAPTNMQAVARLRLLAPMGGSLTLSTPATGVPAPSYQWFLNRTNLIATSTNGLLTLANIQPSQAGDYSVIVSNFLGMLANSVATIEIDPGLLAQAQSSFDSDRDGWTVLSGVETPSFHAGSGNPGGYITATNKYWIAPGKYLGNQSAAYGGVLQFDLIQTQMASQEQQSDVVLSGAGLTLVFKASKNPGATWTSYKVPLTELAGWRKGTLTGPPPSQTEMLEVLANLSDLRIRGVFSTQPDTGGLDNVALLAPPTNSVVLLSGHQTGNQFVFQWPMSAVGFQLQSAANLSPLSWTNVSIAPTPGNGLNSVTLDVPASGQFYRLKRP